ncbi:3-keto-disaccharide hydrolase [Cesiribacter andamanensis]|nr:DUF1080 domain-containing protein [Cesiribacter andamanensis]
MRYPLLHLPLAVLAAGLLLVSCSATPDRTLRHNTLSEQEQQEGWELLFDGQSLQGWHNYGKEGVGPAWRADSGALHLYVAQRAGNKVPGGGDLVTDRVLEGDFELKIDWRVGPLSNSGIFFFVEEDTAQYPEIYHSGMELQIFDDAIYKGVEEENAHRAGDLFGLESAGGNTVRPVGEWNQVHVLHKGGFFRVYMNGVMIHNLDLNSPDWQAAIAGSGLKQAPISRGHYRGRLGLQDWGSEVWYRNIKLREL